MTPSRPGARRDGPAPETASPPMSQFVRPDTDPSCDPSCDPFAHHPELRALVTDPLASQHRQHAISPFATAMKAVGAAPEMLHSDAAREAMRTATLAERRDHDLWVFAYGSLMWDPAIRFAEVRRARVRGYARRFILKDVYGGRGTVEAPGLMAALDACPHGHECGCDGLLFRIARADIEQETEILWRREMVGPSYRALFTPATIRATAAAPDSTVSALAFVADHAAEPIDATLSREEQIRYLATGAGLVGSSLDYLRNIHRKFAAIGVQDEEVAALLREAEAVAAAPSGP